MRGLCWGILGGLALCIGGVEKQLSYFGANQCLQDSRHSSVPVGAPTPTPYGTRRGRPPPTHPPEQPNQPEARHPPTSVLREREPPEPVSVSLRPAAVFRALFPAENPGGFSIYYEEFLERSGASEGNWAQLRL